MLAGRCLTSRGLAGCLIFLRLTGVREENPTTPRMRAHNRDGPRVAVGPQL